MNLSESNTLIDFNTGVSTSNFPNSYRIIMVNSVIDEIHMEILQSLDGWDFDDKNNTDFPILFTDLVANQQDYSLPLNWTSTNDDIIAIKRVEIKYNNSFYKAEAFDQGERGRSIFNTSEINQDFISTAPKYDLLDNSLFLYPIPSENVTGGLKIIIDRSMTHFAEADLSSTTKYFGFDRQFHELVPLKVSLKWIRAKQPENSNKITTLSNEIERLMQGLRLHYGTKNEDREMIIKPAYVDYDTDAGSGGSNRYGPY